MIEMQTPFTVAVPLRTDHDGVIRVGGTRVPLETIIDAYRDGMTAERIHQSFPVLTLAAVYAVIAFYLAQPETVDEYMRASEEEENQVRKMIEEQFPIDPNLKSKLASRLEE
jgi:uncharacterized protein (DUF433 family)